MYFIYTLCILYPLHLKRLCIQSNKSYKRETVISSKLTFFCPFGGLR